MIHGLLDTDLYKLTQMQAVCKTFPRAHAKYEFICRGTSDHRLPTTPAITDAIIAGIHLAAFSRPTAQELSPLVRRGLLEPWFVDLLLNPTHLHPEMVHIRHAPESLGFTVEGTWAEAILWEVPLLAVISEAYQLAPYGGVTPDAVLDEVHDKTRRKADILSDNDCAVVDFGTRRRFSYDVQLAVIKELQEHRCCVGTSNPHFASMFDLLTVGTMAHEWIQGVSGIVGLRHANRYAMQAWVDVYKGKLGIALTDTFGLKPFWGDFDGVLARVYDGVRQDSGDPSDFIKQVLRHYENLGIDPATKTIVFSDALNVDKIVYLKRACGNRIKCLFGIGTNLTCDVQEHPALNMVVKLVEIDGVPVVKLSEDPSKATGDPKAIQDAMWTFGQEAKL